MRILNILDLQQKDYGETLMLQEKLAIARSKGKIDDTLILVEHPTVITRGIKAGNDSIKVDVKELAQLGVQVHDVLRGGAAFIHNPGQLVGYPIILLESGEKRKYLENIQSTLLRVVQNFNINAVMHPNPQYIGTWYVAGEIYYKIAAIGIRFKNVDGCYITQHGFALNVDNDTDIVKQWIYMCGCPTETCISLQQITGIAIAMEKVKATISAEFSRQMAYDKIIACDLNKFAMEYIDEE